MKRLKARRSNGVNTTRGSQSDECANVSSAATQPASASQTESSVEKTIRNPLGGVPHPPPTMRGCLSLLVTVFAVSVPAAEAATQEPIPVTAEPSHHTVFENETIRIIDVQIAPGQQCL